MNAPVESVTYDLGTATMEVSATQDGTISTSTVVLHLKAEDAYRWLLVLSEFFRAASQG